MKMKDEIQEGIRQFLGTWILLKHTKIFGLICFFHFPAVTYPEGLRNSTTNSRLRQDSTHYEHHIKKAIIFEHNAFCPNNLGCFLELVACTTPIFLCGTMFCCNWMVININDVEKHLVMKKKIGGIRTEESLPRSLWLCSPLTNGRTGSRIACLVALWPEVDKEATCRSSLLHHQRGWSLNHTLAGLQNYFI